MSLPRPAPGAIAPAPYLGLHESLMREAEALDGRGDAEAAGALRAAVETWWEAQRRWDEEVSRVLGVHHEIANALVGVRGHTQLLLMGPVGQQPAVRERLEVVIRESGRIQEAAGRIRDLKTALGGPDAPARAA